MLPATCLHFIALICAPFFVCGILFTFILAPSLNFRYFCALLCMCVFTLENYMVSWANKYISVFFAPLYLTSQLFLGEAFIAIEKLSKDGYIWRKKQKT